MAYGDADYCTRDELKVQLRLVDSAGDPLTSPIPEDDALDLAITAASRAIDHFTGRQFGVDTTTSTRYYDVDSQFMLDGRPALAIDDIMSTTSLVVSLDMDDSGDYATTLTIGDDFYLWPTDAPANGRPWTHLVMASQSSNYLPWTNRGVRIVGKFGATSVPDVVRQASLIQAARFFVRRDSAYGVAGSPDLGSEVRLLARLDPDVALLLGTVKRYWAAV